MYETGSSVRLKQVLTAVWVGVFNSVKETFLGPRDKTISAMEMQPA